MCAAPKGSAMPSPPSSPPSKPSSPVIKCHASRSTSPLKPGAKLYTCTTWRGPESTPAAEVAAEVAEVTLTAGFAGEWLQIGIEGDFNAILKAAGVGRVARAAARSCGFGSVPTHTSAHTTHPHTLTDIHAPLSHTLTSAHTRVAGSRRRRA